MLLARWKLALLAVICIAASSGCCSRRGYILHGDWSLELNRLPWRGDDCGNGAGDGSCHGGHGGYGEGENIDSAPPPRSRFHPVPTRDVFSPVIEGEAIPTPAPAEGAASSGAARAVRRSSHTAAVPASSNVPARYSRKASADDCALRGTCDPAAQVAVGTRSPVQSSKTVAPPKQKARLSSTWKAASRT